MDPLTFQPLWTAWAPVAAVVVAVSVAIISLIYLIGKALGSDEMSGWARDELYQAFASAAIIGLVVVVLTTVNSVIYSLLGAAQFDCSQNGCYYQQVSFYQNIDAGTYNNVNRTMVSCGQDTPCQIAIAKSRLNTLFDLVRYWTASNVVNYGIVSLFSSFSIGWKSIASLTPFGVADYLKESYNIMFETTTVILTLLKSQTILLSITEKALFGLFLVGGIALRSIKIMRKTGGLLIAIALGLYFFYPMMIILSSLVISPDPTTMPIVFNDFSHFTQPTAQGAEFNPNMGLPGSPTTVEGGGNTVSSGQTITPSPVYTQIIMSDTKVGDKTFKGISYYLAGVIQPNGFIDGVAFLSVWILALSLITIYSVITFIKELSPYFGGDADIAGLARLV